MYRKFKVTCYLRGVRQVRYFSMRVKEGVEDSIRMELEARGLKYIAIETL